ALLAESFDSGERGEPVTARQRGVEPDLDTADVAPNLAPAREGFLRDAEPVAREVGYRNRFAIGAQAPECRGNLLSRQSWHHPPSFPASISSSDGTRKPSEFGMPMTAAQQTASCSARSSSVTSQ